MPSRCSCKTTSQTRGKFGSNDKGMEDQQKAIYKDFVVIGNGPSGIVLSYFLSGNWPYYTGVTTDEFLHARLEGQPELSLVEQDLDYLSEGLEGRSNNPVALLFDVLQRPDADLGLELPSLLDWRHDKENNVNHVVLGSGLPGGVWQTIEGDMLTVSLGGWMELPNLNMAEWKASAAEKEGSEVHSRRATVNQVSQYYLDYVKVMGLEENFHNNTMVTGVRRITPEEMICPETNARCHIESSNSSPQLSLHRRGSEALFKLDEDKDEDELTSYCSSMTPSSGTSHRETESMSSSSITSTSPPESTQLAARWSPQATNHESPPISGRFYPPNCDIFDECSGRDISMDMFMSRSVYPSVCPSWDPILNPSLFSSSFLGSTFTQTSPCRVASSSVRRCSLSHMTNSYRRSLCPVSNGSQDDIFYEVTGFSTTDSQPFKYHTKNIVLATGMTNKPKKLEVQGEELPFVFHSLSQLEDAVKSGSLTSNSDPVLIVGTGLSAADAIINTQGHNIPIVHSFRRSVDDRTLIFNKLPEALYPEYHAVHRMMAAGTTGMTYLMKGQPIDAEYPGYKAYAETQVGAIHANRKVLLTGPETNELIQVSYVVILIGAWPDLNFLESCGSNLGVVPDVPIDRNNPIDIDVFTHEAINSQGIYAMGPLTGDNFVRFLQGGALAITSHFHHKRKQNRSKRREHLKIPKF